MANAEPGLTTKEEMEARISLLSDEMDANDEENRAMQAEIDALYAKIDALG
jgi:chaperonin cofactor prefoldin